MDIEDFDKLAERYAHYHAALSALKNAFEDELRLLKKQKYPGIQRAAGRLTEAAAELRNAIAANRELFDRPRTRVMHGVKFGLQKGKGRLSWEDEDAVIRKIKQWYDDPNGVLIKTEDRLLRQGLEKLPADELKKLGITVSDAGDQVVLKSADSEIDKWLAAFLEDDSLDEEREAAA
jgi:hypothetical protein